MASLLSESVKVLAIQSCPTLCDTRDCSPPSSSVKEFSGQEYWNGLSFPSPGDLPDPGIEPRSSALQADSLPSKPKGYPNVARCWRLISHFCVPKKEEKERENEGILLDDSASFKWVLSQVFPVTPVYVSLFTPTRRRDEKM